MRKILIVRRIVGKSMAPKLEPGRLVLATGLFWRLLPGEVIIVEHDNKEKIKRIERCDGDKIFVIGDNLPASTDSRHFGWLDRKAVIGKVLFPRLD